MLKNFIVGYDLDYTRVARFAIEAETGEAAVAHATAKFHDMTLWNDQAGCRTLHFALHETQDNTLNIHLEGEMVLPGEPAGDQSVAYMHQSEAAHKAATALVRACAGGDAPDPAIEEALAFARKALPEGVAAQIERDAAREAA